MVFSGYGDPAYILIYRPGDAGKIRDFLEVQLAFDPIIDAKYCIYRTVFVEFHRQSVIARTEVMLFAWQGGQYVEMPPSTTVTTSQSNAFCVSDADVIDYCHAAGIRCDYGDVAN